MKILIFTLCWYYQKHWWNNIDKGKPNKDSVYTSQRTEFNSIRKPDCEYNTGEQNTVYYKNHTELYWKYKHTVGKLRGVSVNIFKEIFVLYETWISLNYRVHRSRPRSVLNKNNLPHTLPYFFKIHFNIVLSAVVGFSKKFLRVFRSEVFVIFFQCTTLSCLFITLEIYFPTILTSHIWLFPYY